MTHNNTTQRSIRIPDDLWQRVQSQAAQDHINVSELVRGLLRGWLDTDNEGGRMSVHKCETWQMMESAKGGWYCGACGKHEGPEMTAEEKAMEEIGAALDAFFKGHTTMFDALNAVARANGAYSVDCIGEACPETHGHPDLNHTCLAPSGHE